jgi:hypothetical protein
LTSIVIKVHRRLALLGELLVQGKMEFQLSVKVQGDGSLEMHHDPDPDVDGYTNIEEYLNNTHPYQE